MSDETFPGPIEIPLTKAREWEKRYDDDTSVGDSKSKMKAFLIPRESLEKVLTLNTEAVRAYLAINDRDEKILFFVGAKKDEKTGKYIDVYGEKITQSKMADDETVVYDASRPSPPY